MYTQHLGLGRSLLSLSSDVESLFMQRINYIVILELEFRILFVSNNVTVNIFIYIIREIYIIMQLFFLYHSDI